MLSIQTEIEINGEPTMVIVDFEFYPGDPGVNRYSNGDPGYPPTGDEVEVLSVQHENGNTIPDDLIILKWSEHIIEACHNHVKSL